MDKKVQKIEEIFGRVASGDRVALQEFIAVHSTRICRRIAGKLRVAGVRGDDDLVEDLLLSISRRADEALVLKRINAGDAATLEHYILGLAANRAHEEARSVWRRRDVLAALASQGPPRPHADSLSDEVEEAKVILNRLDPDDRETVLLMVRGVQVDVIADLAGISEAALRKRFTRLKTALRECWGRRSVEGGVRDRAAAAGSA